MDGQSELVFEDSSGRARCYNLKTGQHIKVLPRKLDHLVLATIVGDQCNTTQLPTLHHG
jgi:hypothetical protein